MAITEWLALGGVGVGLVTLAWKMSVNGRSERKRIYSRIDSERDRVSATYVRQDLCAERHQRVSDDLKEIKNDLKEIKSDMKQVLK